MEGEPASIRDALADPAQRTRFDELLAEASADWPGLELDADAFIDYLDERCEDLEQVHLSDLVLAFGCLSGQRSALEAFEREYDREIRGALARLAKQGLNADDLRQALREKLFAGDDAKIGEYAGRGRLRNWVRITMLRMRIDAERRRKVKREVYDDDGGRIAALPAVEHDPELAHMKQHYRAAFRDSFEAASRKLSPRQRNLLRQKLSEGLSTAQIASLYQVHRATMKRWLAAARELLLRETRRELSQRVGIDDGELESVMRLIASNFDVSVRRMLETRSS